MFQVPVPWHLLQSASLSVYLWHSTLGLLLENLSLHLWSCLWRAWSPCLQGTPCDGCVSAVEEIDKVRKSCSACRVGLSSSNFGCGAEEKTLTVKPKQQKLANTVLEQSSCLRCSRVLFNPLFRLFCLTLSIYNTTAMLLRDLVKCCEICLKRHARAK